MIKKLFFFCLLITVFTAQAQQGLLFSSKHDQREILVLEGDLVKFSYSGYLGQKEVKYGVVFSIQDSIVGIIATVASGGFFKTGTTEVRYIKVKDITGFRKFHRSRPYVMSLSSIVVTVGSIILYYSIDKHSNLTFAEKFGISVGTGLISSSIVRLAFPERIKNKIGDDWEVKVLK